MPLRNAVDPRRYDINLSILFTELDLLERPSAAAKAGFRAVEYWWPFPVAAPSEREVDRFARAVEDAGVSLVGLNFFAGDMPGGERGVLSHPGRSQEFRDSVDIAVGLGERLGCRSFNALYGNRIDGIAESEQDGLAAENLRHAAEAVRKLNGTVLIEPVSGTPAYPLKTASDVVAVIDRLRAEGADNLRLLFDLYHLAVNGDDPDAVLSEHADLIGHVQLADAPGRNEPGTGEIDFEHYLGTLERAGYGGYIGLEYKPSGTTTDSLAWLE